MPSRWNRTMPGCYIEGGNYTVVEGTIKAIELLQSLDLITLDEEDVTLIRNVQDMESMHMEQKPEYYDYLDELMEESITYANNQMVFGFWNWHEGDFLLTTLTLPDSLNED